MTPARDAAGTPGTASPNVTGTPDLPDAQATPDAGGAPDADAAEHIPAAATGPAANNAHIHPGTSTPSDAARAAAGNDTAASPGTDTGADTGATPGADPGAAATSPSAFGARGASSAFGARSASSASRTGGASSTGEVAGTGSASGAGGVAGTGAVAEPFDEEHARLEEAYLMDSHGWEPTPTDTPGQPPLDDTFATTQPAPPQKPSHAGDRDTARDTDWGIDWDADQDTNADGEVGPVGPVGAGGAVDAGAPVDEDTFTRRGLAATLTARLAAIKHDAHRTGLGAGSTGRGRARHTVYVHLTDLTLATGTGVLRVEELGPQLATQLTELLGHDHFVVKPVIDLHDQVSVHSYEIPDRIRERVRLRHPVDMFPFSGAEATVRMDQDHITPYDHTRARDHGADPEPPPGDQPGQTSVDNLIPQGRLHHRAKTFGGWHNRRLPTGAVAWTSPHGFRFIVDHTGTHQLPRNRTRGP
ncbi:hypothetical protein [Kribbella sp. NPDC048915]|uniref:hypothetical protein n=1 Tax=Kribbella sp. NPDC048915 TaxID=3155148 RepID=UPI0033E281D1